MDNYLSLCFTNLSRGDYMEILLFYDYLNYQAGRKSFKKVLFRIPFYPMIFLVISVSSLIIALFHKAQTIKIIAIIVEIIFCWLTEYSIEKFQIKNSKVRISDYYKYCWELKKWLQNNSIKNCEDIKEIKKRIENHIGVYKEEQKALSNRNDKWFQVLVVPITILIITYMVNQSISIIEKTGNIVSVLLVFAFFYGSISAINNASRFLKNQKVEQMEFFATDLQGVLDLDRFGIKISD